jgi:hypothetical protein
MPADLVTFEKVRAHVHRALRRAVDQGLITRADLVAAAGMALEQVELDPIVSVAQSPTDPSRIDAVVSFRVGIRECEHAWAAVHGCLDYETGKDRVCCQRCGIER